MTTATHKFSPYEPQRDARQQCGVGVTRRRNPTIWLPVLRYALDSAEEAEAVTRVESMLVEAGIKTGHGKSPSKRDWKHSLDVEVGSVVAAAKRLAEQC